MIDRGEHEAAKLSLLGLVETYCADGPASARPELTLLQGGSAALERRLSACVRST